MQLFALSLVLAASTAQATQAPAAAPALTPSRARGVVESIDANTLKIKTDQGAEVVATITPKSRFATVEARTFAQIKPTDFVGITAVPGKNGHLSAEEIHVIPIVGMGEGQYPWDHHPSSSQAPTTAGSMTNGTISTTSAAPMRSDTSMTNGSVTKASGAWQFTVTYHGAQMVDGKCEGHAMATMPGMTASPGCTGTAIVDVSPSTAIAAIVPGTQADAKPGLRVVAGLATDNAGHTYLGSATLEKGGVKPEF